MIKDVLKSLDANIDLEKVKQDILSAPLQYRCDNSVSAIVVKAGLKHEVAAIAFSNEEAQRVIEKEINPVFEPIHIHATNLLDTQFSRIIQALAVGKLALVEDTPLIEYNTFCYLYADNLAAATSYIYGDGVISSKVVKALNECKYNEINAPLPFSSDLADYVKINTMAKIVLAHNLSSVEDTTVFYVAENEEEVQQFKRNVSELRDNTLKIYPFMNQKKHPLTVHVSSTFSAATIDSMRTGSALVVINKNVDQFDAVRVICKSLAVTKNIKAISF